LATLLLAPFIPLMAADEDPVLRVKLNEPQPEYKNRFGISYRAGFNITAQFKNVGNVARGAGGRGPGPATGGGIDRFYDDGYNRVDTSGNKDGLTWFWGYKDNETQVPGNDTLVMHSTTVSPITSKTIDSDPEHGGEVTWNREFCRSEKNKWICGLEGAFGWTDIDIRDHRPLVGGERKISDAFDLGGVNPNVPPQNAQYPGHAGTFEGPGPLIDDSPTRTTMYSPNGATVFGTRRFDGDLWTFRLGPYMDFPLDDKWTFSLSAGAAVGVLDGEFQFRQVASTSSGSGFQSGSGNKTEVLYGGFVSATIHYAITEQWGAFVGGQYLGLTGYSAKAAGQKIELDLARTAFLVVGMSLTF
jgi:hypothetical protein